MSRRTQHACPVVECAAHAPAKYGGNIKLPECQPVPPMLQIYKVRTLTSFRNLSMRPTTAGSWLVSRGRATLRVSTGTSASRGMVLSSSSADSDRNGCFYGRQIRAGKRENGGK